MTTLSALLSLAQLTPAQMPARSWIEIPNSQMRSVIPKEGQFPKTWGVCGPASVVSAWCGAALDTKRSRLILWGGGHNDYYGNELYAFDCLRLAWERLTDPTPDPTLSHDANADGTPNSRHTYNGLAYISGADVFFGFGGATAGQGWPNSGYNTWTFDLKQKKWANRKPSGTLPRGGVGCNCSFDPITGMVWWCESSGVYSYDYRANAWTKRDSEGFYYMTSAVDSKRHLMVIVGDKRVSAYDLTNRQAPRQTWNTTGGDKLVHSANPGLDYDPVSDRIVGWNGGAVYALDVDAKRWTAVEVSGAQPQSQWGTYGRWRYVPTVNAFVVVNDYGKNVMFFKLTAGDGRSASAGTAASRTKSPFSKDSIDEKK